MIPISHVSPYTSFFSFMLGIPTLIGTYYQAWRTRQEARAARQSAIFSKNCLEFVTAAGVTINLIALETLHTLPKPDDIVFLPGESFVGGSEATGGAYRIQRIEHIYASFDEATSRRHHLRPGQARLAKVVAHVTNITY